MSLEDIADRMERHPRRNEAPLSECSALARIVSAWGRWVLYRDIWALRKADQEWREYLTRCEAEHDSAR
jgi:hypothetical protein